MDFKVNIEHDGKVKILQLTDMQVIDSMQRRTPDRLRQDEIDKWLPETMEDNIFSHIRYLINKTKPDLIIITGDIIYGEFDDSGKTFEIFVEFMDSFKIPWAPVYGNHDNESYKGIAWQNEQFENSEYALFKKGNVFGNGNYTIGIYQHGKLIRTLYMVDSNGCARINISQGFRDDQLEWIKSEAKLISGENPEAKSFMCFHIPTDDFTDAYIAAGYQNKYDNGNDDYSDYALGKDVAARDGEFGNKHERFDSTGQKLIALMKECSMDGIFAGHYHKANLSVVYEGVRFTLGYKTGFYDYHDKDAMGGTLIELDTYDFEVSHVQYPEI